MITFLSGIGGRLFGILAAIGGVIALLWKVRHDGEVSGATKIENLDLRANQAASAKAAEVRRDVRSMDDAAVRDGLRRKIWRK